MSNALSAAALLAIFAQQTGEVFLLLVSISHTDMGSTIRVVANNENVVHGGNTYNAFPFEINLPDEDPERIARPALKICNVNREIVAAFRALGSAATVEMTIVLASSPDTIERGPFEYLARHITYDASAVTVQLAHEDVLNEPIPGDSINPEEYPGAFE